MTDLLKHILASQFHAALAMMADCVQRCPDHGERPHWDEQIARYPFWHVAYHTLCFVDLYLTPGGEAAFATRPDFHPRGMAEFDDEYPSRRFTKPEITAYLDLCRALAAATLAAETSESLAGPCGHARRRFSRAELHIYNIRHIQHHTGQLSASLRRIGEAPVWVGMAAP